MIVVKVELWPLGVESQAREIGRAHISNVGGNNDFGNYQVELLKSAEYSRRRAGEIYRRGKVINYQRERGPWPLLMYALQSALRIA